MRTRLARAALATIVAAGALACSSGDDDGDAAAAEPGTEGSIAVEVTDASTCDPLDTAACALPFPSDFFTTEDDGTDTGRRVAFGAESLPENTSGVHIDPAEWNRNDGFSPGSLVMTVVPGLDAEASKLPPVTDIGRSLDDASPIVLLDADENERVPFWAEIDSRTAETDTPILIVTPARALREGHRHVVAFRDLVDTAGRPIEAGDVFRAYRDRLDTGDDALEARRAAMEAVLSDLDAAGVERDGLYLAWDFTVASERSLSARLLHMRDDAFAALGDGAPAFEVTETSQQGIARVVRGTFDVPRYLTGDGSPGQTLNNDDDPDGIPTANGTHTANFVCTVPTAATAANPARVSLYGHGLLGSANEAVGIGTVAATVNVSFCATDWIGMSTEDVPNAAAVLGDLGRFRSWADRMLQGHLDFLFLGRLVRHEDGFVTHPAFQDASGGGVLDRSDLFFLGASQGGILGGATSAVATDWSRAVLAVPGMNYSVLLRRSIDFDDFAPVLADAYPDPLDQQLGIALVQMLWDRGENQGYAQHLTADPYDGTQPKDVMLLEAFGDHQVANVATENLARTIGARLRVPALEEGRSLDAEPFFGIEPIDSYPAGGSVLVVWDFGTPPPPPSNVPPREGEDPHGKAGEVPAVLLMVSEFLKTEGKLVDVCDGAPCRTLGT